MSVEKLAMKYGSTCYISFETALSYYCVIDQCIFKVSWATLRDDFEFKYQNFLLEFINIDEDNFFGYMNMEGSFGDKILYAEAEKAFVDWIWLYELRGWKIQLDEINWAVLSREKVDNYSKKMGINYLRYMVNIKEYKECSHPKYAIIAQQQEQWLNS